MAGFDKKMKRRILVGMILPCLCILGMVALIILRCLSLMFGAEGDGWRRTLEKENPRDSLIVKQHRGNIYSCDGLLIASSVEQHKLMIDFRRDGFDEALFYAKIDSLCVCMEDFYGKIRTAAEYKNMALDAKKKGIRYFSFEPVYVSHNQYKQACTFPYFKEDRVKTGFYINTRVERVKTFGNLASRTIGNFNKETGRGMSGLEKRFETELAGEPGIAREEIHGKRVKVKVPIVEPLNGVDVYTTLDMRMQDVVTSALADVMRTASADSGCAILMDVQTGEIKALSNLTHCGSSYVDQKNYAVGMNSEPGSVFKLASVIALLEVAGLDTSYIIDTGDGYWEAKNMHDHNYDKYGRGGFGKISLAHAFHVSSNIGIAKPVWEYFSKRKEKFVQKLYAMKLADHMDLDIPNDVRPIIRDFNNPTVRNDGTYLTSMSIGYSVQIPPIYTLTFYNAIANEGKMVKPQFVKSIKRDGKTLQMNQVEVVCPKVCNNQTLGKVKDMLKGVFEQGTGKKAKSDILELAGKSGTARMHYNNPTGTARDYQSSFVGFFPADNPQYSCMVVYWQTSENYKLYNNMTSKAFRTISERIYAMTPVSCETPICDKVTSAPEVKGGYKRDVEYLMKELKVGYLSNFLSDDDFVYTTVEDSMVSMKSLDYADLKSQKMPRVIGLGAKEALYILENKGLKVTMRGRGRVVQQSLPAGEPISPGKLITIMLK